MYLKSLLSRTSQQQPETALKRLKVIKLGIGDFHVSQEPCLLVCHGLGSCVGLFLFDRTLKMGGGAHIQLPSNIDPRIVDDGRFADFAFRTMLSEMKKQGSQDGHISAKITGGAQINKIGKSSVGDRNVKKVRELLMSEKIYLARSETGGNAYRKASFNTANGQLGISKQHVELIL